MKILGYPFTRSAPCFIARQLLQSATNLIVGCQVIVLVVARLARTAIVRDVYFQLNITGTAAFANFSLLHRVITFPSSSLLSL